MAPAAAPALKPGQKRQVSYSNIAVGGKLHFSFILNCIVGYSGTLESERNRAHTLQHCMLQIGNTMLTISFLYNAITRSNQIFKRLCQSPRPSRRDHLAIMKYDQLARNSKIKIK